MITTTGDSNVNTIKIATNHGEPILITVDKRYLYVTVDCLFVRVDLFDLIFEDKYKAISSRSSDFRLVLSNEYHDAKDLIIGDRQVTCNMRNDVNTEIESEANTLLNSRKDKE